MYLYWGAWQAIKRRFIIHMEKKDDEGAHSHSYTTIHLQHTYSYRTYIPTYNPTNPTHPRLQILLPTLQSYKPTLHPYKPTNLQTLHTYNTTSLHACPAYVKNIILCGAVAFCRWYNLERCDSWAIIWDVHVVSEPPDEGKGFEFPRQIAMLVDCIIIVMIMAVGFRLKAYQDLT